MMKMMVLYHQVAESVTGSAACPAAAGSSVCPASSKRKFRGLGKQDASKKGACSSYSETEEESEPGMSSA